MTVTTGHFCSPALCWPFLPLLLPSLASCCSHLPSIVSASRPWLMCYVSSLFHSCWIPTSSMYVLVKSHRLLALNVLQVGWLHHLLTVQKVKNTQFCFWQLQLRGELSFSRESQRRRKGNSLFPPNFVWVVITYSEVLHRLKRILLSYVLFLTWYL